LITRTDPILVRIQSSGGLSEADIERMVKDAELHEEEDRKRRDETEARNHAEAVIYDIEKNLRDFKDYVQPSEADTLREEIKNLQKTLEGGDLEAIRTGADALQRESLKAFEAAYRQKASTNDSGASGSSSSSTPDEETDKKDDDTVDADYTEDKKKRK
jgi:molecular chaperone DnaK